MDRSFAVPGTLFRRGTQIKLTVQSGDAIFSFLALQSTGGVQQPPYGAALNLPPAFASDALAFTNAAVGAPFVESIAPLATDPDYGETLAFSKVSGPAWLAVSPNGALSGMPLSADAGTNSFVVQVGDAGGLTDQATLTVVATVSVAPSDPYADWARAYDLAGGETDDDDNDGLPNLYEYAVGGNPTNAGDVGFASTTAVFAIGGTNWFEYVYPRRKGVSGLAYRLELSDDLTSTNWVSGGYIEIPPAGNLDAEFEAVTNRVDTTGTQKKFIRLGIGPL